jgi:glycosyltransferase involved in cell wall biosynthesis
VHILYVIDSLGSGGAQRQAVELAIELHRAHGVRAEFAVYRHDDFYGPLLREAGIPVQRIEKSGKYDLRFPWRLRRWVREQRPDVVHAFLLLPSLWARLAVRGLGDADRPPLIASERGSLIAETRVGAALQRFVYGGSDAVTVNAVAAGHAIVRELGVPAARVRYLPNGIDLERWDREARGPCPFELEPGRFQLALVGGLRPEKNHRLVLEALERLGRERVANWRVWFVGGESFTAAFAQGVRDAIVRQGLDSVVRIAPPTPAIAALMRRLDAVLLPSAHEGFPNVALEAMASGVPVIASGVGDVPNMIESGRTGFVLERLSAECLAAAMAQLHDLGAAARRAIGARARADVEARFRMGAVAREYLALYGEVLEARAAGRSVSSRTGERPGFAP